MSHVDVDAIADVANEGCTPAELAATTAHEATAARPTIATTTGALRRDCRDDNGFATNGAACEEIYLGGGREGRRPQAFVLDENGLGARACSSSGMGWRTPMLGFTFRGSRVSGFLSARVKTALFVYCSSIFLGTRAAGVRALAGIC